MRLFKSFALAFVAPASLSATLPSPFGAAWSVERHTTLDHIPASQGSVEAWHLRRATGTGAVVTLVLVVLPSDRNRAFIEHVDRIGATSSVYSPGFCKGALAVANGNFFIDDNNRKSPLGLLKVGGKTVTKTSRRKSGGFLIIDTVGRVAVLPKRMVAQAEAARDALESTPVLIRNGGDDMRGDQGDRFDRVGVGNSRNGATIMVGAFARDQQTVSLAEFSKLAIAALKSKRIVPDGLLAMDGGPSAHLWFPAKKALYGHRGAAYLPSAICVKPK